MNSMTGYGSSLLNLESYPLALEFSIQSVNRKNLDCQISVPTEWSGLDRSINSWVKGQLERGRITIQLKAKKRTNTEIKFKLNHARLNERIEEFSAYAQSNNLRFELDAPTLIQLSQLIEGEDALPDWEEHERRIHQAFTRALESFQDMRSEEGRRLKVDIEKRIHGIQSSLLEIKQFSKSAPKEYATLLQQRLKSMNLALDLDDERILKEIALFSDRTDITEEIVRLESHFEQFNSFLSLKEAVGRKMDFLCIEIFRELNTIASKTSQVEVTRLIIDCKNELERIREQVQNIE